MDWVPVVFIAFKLLVLGMVVFFSIKSHHDKEKEEQEEERERQARASGTGNAIQLGQVQQHVEGSQCARKVTQANEVRVANEVRGSGKPKLGFESRL